MLPPTKLIAWIMGGVGAIVLTLFGAALVASLLGTDATFKSTMGTGAYGLASLVVGYYFGSSAGSDRKTDLMHLQRELRDGDHTNPPTA